MSTTDNRVNPISPAWLYSDLERLQVFLLKRQHDQDMAVMEKVNHYQNLLASVQPNQMVQPCL